MAQTALDRNFGEISFKFRRWSLELTPEQTLEDTFVPSFWKMQAAAIMGHDKSNPKGRGDIIEVRKPDTGLYAELLVTEVGSGYVRVQPLKAYEPPKVEDKDGSLTTKWDIATKTHKVIRRSDNHVMASGFQTKTSANEWIETFRKQLAA